MHLLSVRKLCCDLFLLFFFVLFFRDGKGEERLFTKKRIMINSNASIGIVNPNIKLVYLQALEAQAKLHKTQVQSAWVSLSFASASL